MLKPDTENLKLIEEIRVDVNTNKWEHLINMNKGAIYGLVVVDFVNNLKPFIIEDLQYIKEMSDYKKLERY